MKLYSLFLTIMFCLSLQAQAATKRQAIRALNKAYEAVMSSEEDFDYQMIIDMADEMMALAKIVRLTCKPDVEKSGWYQLYDGKAQKQLSIKADTLANCRAAIEDSRSGLICTHQGRGWYHLYDRNLGKNISESAMPYGQCVRGIR